MSAQRTTRNTTVEMPLTNLRKNFFQETTPQRLWYMCIRGSQTPKDFLVSNSLSPVHVSHFLMSGLLDVGCPHEQGWNAINCDCNQLQYFECNHDFY